MRDTRHGVRRLLRDWPFTVAAVLILGLGIGANTAMFSLINATLFREQSLADPRRLVDIYQNAVNAEGVDANSYPACLDMAAYTDVFASTMAASVPHAVVAFAVSRRSREIGIRMALGARGQQVVWAVAREVAMLVGVGTGIGLALSLMAIQALRIVRVSTPGVSLYRPTVDPAALLAIAAFMAIVGVAAAYMPARRAARMDPLVALRHD